MFSAVVKGFHSPVTVLPALLVLEHDHDSLADLALQDLNTLILALGSGATGAVVGRYL